MAGLLDFCGWNVTREYYINDAGAQVDTLARSAHLRYCEALGRKIGDIPAGLYPGAYLVEVGQKLAAAHGEAFLDADEAEWLEPVRSFTIEAMMDGVRQDLEALGISMDRFSSERALVDSGAVAAAIERLTNDCLLYTSDAADD